MNKLISKPGYLGLMFLIVCCRSNHDGAIIRMKLAQNWFIKSSLEVIVPDSIVSTGNFEPSAWYPATVPSTVLATLVKNKVYPDPRSGMNNFLIPDVSDTFNSKHNLARFSYLKNKANPWKDPYWYRTEFSIPQACKGKEVWLNLNSINYRADVWLNGHLVADKEKVAGMFLRFRLNITRYVAVHASNYLAIKIYQVDHPGIPDPGTQFKVFGASRGHASDIFKDETLKFTGGWDCAPVVHDRNMGICQDVYITTTGSVSIENPCVITDLPLPDTSRADLDITAEITNTSGHEISGTLNGTVDLVNVNKFPSYDDSLGGTMPRISLDKKVFLKANETQVVRLNPKEFPQLVIHNPHLWWPNGYGKQYLHKLNLRFYINKELSDSRDVKFGIREVKNELKKIGPEYGRVFLINGRRIFCKGGWIQPDALLEMDNVRINNEARLLARANVNMLGSEDAPAPSEDIMETYDKYGLMIWETFFQCYRSYPGTDMANNPADHQLAIREVSDIMKRYRNNPSLVIWCLANEVTVCRDLYVPIRKIIPALDSTRPFIPCTSFDWDVDKLTPYIKGDLPLGTTDAGEPDYTWYPEPYYFKKILEIKNQTFRNEMGSPSLPVYSSLVKFIPDAGNVRESPVYPLDSIWAEHGAWDLNGYAYKKYDNAIRTFYGNPVNAEDYAKKAQFVNATSYRAMFEAANHRMWDITSGVMIWKLNSCWPDVCWQIYDWYLCPNASYYYTRKALEPIHIQLNANNSVISVINTRSSILTNMEVSARMIDIQMHTKWEINEKCTINADGYTELGKVPEAAGLNPVYFVELQLMDPQGKIVSRNVYWFPSKQSSDMSVLSHPEQADLNITATGKRTGRECEISVKLKNNSGKLSFFNRLKITRGPSGEEALPVFWDDNFITLFPSEEKTVKVIIALNDLNGSQPFLSIDGSTQEPIQIRF